MTKSNFIRNVFHEKKFHWLISLHGMSKLLKINLHIPNFPVFTYQGTCSETKHKAALYCQAHVLVVFDRLRNFIHLHLAITTTSPHFRVSLYCKKVS